MNLSGGEIVQSLRPFFENNYNISQLKVEDCQFGDGCVRQIALALKRCNKSLVSVSIADTQIGDERSAEIIEALSVHPQLDMLELVSVNIGRQECTALANLLRYRVTNLQELKLSGNDIDDEGVDVLVGALANSRLQSLDLSSNSNISARGCQSLASMLECSKYNLLENFYLSHNNIGDEGAHILANALASNHKLKFLDLENNGITAKGCQSLAALLESANSNLETLDLRQNNVGDKGAFILANALASNFKLESLDLSNNAITAKGCQSLAALLESPTLNLESLYLANNNIGDEEAYIFATGLANNCKLKHLYLNNNGITAEGWEAFSKAIANVLEHHQHFDMQPFFEWEMKMLPVAIDWFERARFIESIDEVGIDKQKMDAIYQFIRGMPEVLCQFKQREKEEAKWQTRGSEVQSEVDEPVTGIQQSVNDNEMNT